MAKNNTSLYIVLGILDAGAKSGYDIKKTIEYEIGHYYKISNGQIYPALKKLMQMGCATLAVEKNDGKPDRKVYSITPKGRDVAREWLNRPVDYQNPNGNELLLKLYFGALQDIGRNIDRLSEYKLMKEGYLKLYSEIRSNFNGITLAGLPEVYSCLTLRYGQMLVKASVDWCEEAIGILGGLKESPEKPCETQ